MHERERRTNADEAPGETGLAYTLAVADLGAMIGLRITATNAAGSNFADAVPVGPVTAPAPLRRVRRST